MLSGSRRRLDCPEVGVTGICNLHDMDSEVTGIYNLPLWILEQQAFMIYLKWILGTQLGVCPRAVLDLDH